MQDAPTQKSEFNMAIEHLRTIRQLQNKADEASIMGDANLWSKLLLAIYREVSTYMKPEVKNYLTLTYIQPLERLLAQNQQAKPGHINSALHTNLHNFDIALREVLDNGGLLTRYADDAMKALR